MMALILISLEWLFKESVVTPCTNKALNGFDARRMSNDETKRERRSGRKRRSNSGLRLKANDAVFNIAVGFIVGES